MKNGNENSNPFVKEFNEYHNISMNLADLINDKEVRNQFLEFIEWLKNNRTMKKIMEKNKLIFGFKDKGEDVVSYNIQPDFGIRFSDRARGVYGLSINGGFAFEAPYDNVDTVYIKFNEGD
ncbi:MAG: hypothetical protein QXO75_09235 [Nitrososphaerota archaeon]